MHWEIVRRAGAAARITAPGLLVPFDDDLYPSLHTLQNDG